MSGTQRFIVGLGGTTRSDSSSERALRMALTAAERQGAEIALFGGPDLILPMYDPQNAERDARAQRLITALRRADGVVLASPGYHGSISGLLKNALDYIEDMRSDERPYLHGRAVGCIACAYGWQATGTTLNALRSIVHALRGWPTPLGIGINSGQTTFGPTGTCSDGRVIEQLDLLGSQVTEFALRWRRLDDLTVTGDAAAT
jgi:FMN reductase